MIWIGSFRAGTHQLLQNKIGLVVTWGRKNDQKGAWESEELEMFNTWYMYFLLIYTVQNTSKSTLHQSVYFVAQNQ